MNSLEEIPVLDVGPYLRNESGAGSRLAAELKNACERIGFYFLVNHGVPQARIDGMFDDAKAFHGLPIEEKMAMKKNEHNVGYVPPGGVRSNSGDGFDNTKNKADVHAAFHVNRDFSIDHPYVASGRKYYVPQPWPASLPGFSERVTAYHRAMEDLGRRLLPVYAMALGAPTNAFDAMFVDPLTVLRLIHYPTVSERRDDQFGAGAHTDVGFLTFLPQTEVPGLEIQTQSGRWIPAPIVPGGVLVNAGKVLKRLSNDAFLSTPHRVLSPVAGKDRYSIPFFFNPSADALIQCLPSCVSSTRPPRYEPMSYGGFLDWFIDNTYVNAANRPAV